jgi:hypothetical protein
MFNDQRKRQVSIGRVASSSGPPRGKFDVKPKTPWNTFFTSVDVDEYLPTRTALTV